MRRADNLPDPDEIAEEIVENLEAGLESFRSIITALSKKVDWGIAFWVLGNTH